MAVQPQRGAGDWGLEEIRQAHNFIAHGHRQQCGEGQEGMEDWKEEGKMGWEMGTSIIVSIKININEWVIIWLHYIIVYAAVMQRLSDMSQMWIFCLDTEGKLGISPS